MVLSDKNEFLEWNLPANPHMQTVALLYTRGVMNPLRNKADIGRSCFRAVWVKVYTSEINNRLLLSVINIVLESSMQIITHSS